MFWSRKTTSLGTTGIQTPDRSAHILVATPTVGSSASWYVFKNTEMYSTSFYQQVLASWSQMLYFLYQTTYYADLTDTQIVLYPKNIPEELIRTEHSCCFKSEGQHVALASAKLTKYIHFTLIQSVLHCPSNVHCERQFQAINTRP